MINITGSARTDQSLNDLKILFADGREDARFDSDVKVQTDSRILPLVNMGKGFLDNSWIGSNTK